MRVVFRFLLIQMYSEEDATDVGAPTLADERRYEYKKLLMKALADVCNLSALNYGTFSYVSV